MSQPFNKLRINVRRPSISDIISGLPFYRMAVLSKNLSLKFASIFYPYLIGDHEPGSVYVDLLIPGFPSGVGLVGANKCHWPGSCIVFSFPTPEADEACLLFTWIIRQINKGFNKKIYMGLSIFGSDPPP